MDDYSPQSGNSHKKIKFSASGSSTGSSSCCLTKNAMITIHIGPVKLPECTEDYDWTNILDNKFARDYQVQCFVESLQRDMVAVLPTGAGKTLIASMLLKRMKELNPEKMGLFIVDRIPLVFQQAKVWNA